MLQAGEEAEVRYATYARYYSTARLREMASRIKGSRHGDLWEQFGLVVGALSGDERFRSVRKHLGLPALGGFLWEAQSTPHLNAAALCEGVRGEENPPPASFTPSSLRACVLSNHDFLEAIRDLAFIRQGATLRTVDYKSLGAEELGGIYEGLLALTPRISGDGAHFSFVELAGNERKTSGSYYTPDSLVQCLLDTALEPVVKRRLADARAAQKHAAPGSLSSPALDEALRDLKILDPAVGSGHFLVAAAHRLARHVSEIRAWCEGEGAPSPLDYQKALRDVVGRCLYGVDRNPMAAELCRVNLWLEALEPGMPLTFLDHHIRVGDSLIGATPELIAAGVPDAAFTPIEGDDTKLCTELRARNKKEREGRQGSLFAPQVFGSEGLRHLWADLEAMDDRSIDGVRRKSQRFKEVQAGMALRRQLADAWCAAFFLPKLRGKQDTETPAVTSEALQLLAVGESLPGALAAAVEASARAFGFFHPHLAFPEAMACDGFDAVLGNPPWERVKLQEKEWFAQRAPEIAAARHKAARERLIAEAHPHLLREIGEAKRQAEAVSGFIRNSGRFPLCGRGDVNTYAVFAELFRHLAGDRGRAGVIVPTGIATDDTTKHFFAEMVSDNSLRAVLDFENSRSLFSGVHRSFKFCLLTMGRSAASEAALFSFFSHSADDLKDPERTFHLTPADILLLNPNTHTCPVFRTRRDAELTKAIYRRVPILSRHNARAGNPWGFDYMTKMFDMADSSHEFLDIQELVGEGYSREGTDYQSAKAAYAPLYEAKHVHLFNHRWGEAKSVQDGHTLPFTERLRFLTTSQSLSTRYWVPRLRAEERLRSKNWTRPWIIGWRDITNATNERTAIAAVLRAILESCG